jgi:hypothetical protein
MECVVSPVDQRKRSQPLAPETRCPQNDGKPDPQILSSEVSILEWVLLLCQIVRPITTFVIFCSKKKCFETEVYGFQVNFDPRLLL